jgi:hypothetical protein
MIKVKKIVSAVSAFATAVALSTSGVLGLEDTVDLKNVDSKFQGITRLTPSLYVKAALNTLLGLAGIIAFFFLLWGGISWIIAGGDKEGTDKARKRITSALIGLAIVFSAYALIFIIQALFGVDFFQFTLKPIA